MVLRHFVELYERVAVRKWMKETNTKWRRGSGKADKMN